MKEPNQLPMISYQVTVAGCLGVACSGHMGCQELEPRRALSRYWVNLSKRGAMDGVF